MLFDCPQHLQEELFPFVSSGTALLRAAVKSSARACLLPAYLSQKRICVPVFWDGCLYDVLPK